MKLVCTFLLLIPFNISFHDVCFGFNNIKYIQSKSFPSFMVQDVLPIEYDIELVIENGPIPRPDRVFVIDGWRWHTKSVLRDLNRFEIKLKSEISNIKIDFNRNFTSCDDIVKCYDFVCNFNWKSLIGIERDIFFPWLLKILPRPAQPKVRNMSLLHLQIQQLFQELNLACLGYTQSKNASYLERAIHIIDDLRACALTMQNTQEMLFVPYISSFVSAEEQTRLNKKVVAALGLINSQIHLVGMTEAIRGDTKEEMKLRSQVPFLALTMIPLLKKRLYLPMTKCLEES